jgi:hypothetical protein
VFLSDLLLNVGVYPRKVGAADKLIPAKLQIERDAVVIHRVAAQPVSQFPGLHAQLCGGLGYGQAVAHLPSSCSGAGEGCDDAAPAELDHFPAAHAPLGLYLGIEVSDLHRIRAIFYHWPCRITENRL